MQGITVVIASTTEQFVLTQADQDYILLLGLGCFIYLLIYRAFSDYYGLV